MMSLFVAAAATVVLSEGQQTGLTLNTYTNMGLFGTPATSRRVDTSAFSLSGIPPNLTRFNPPARLAPVAY